MLEFFIIRLSDHLTKRAFRRRKNREGERSDVIVQNRYIEIYMYTHTHHIHTHTHTVRHAIMISEDIHDDLKNIERVCKSG